ncbi:MAG TPA: glycosyltransferase family 2 protein [Acidimicrobiales bacterium]|jgi:hypothetical protein|nr:glycosyltransferase family 2 protein [Acidimicrobiales bacterium]
MSGPGTAPTEDQADLPLSVVMVTWNSAKVAGECLRSLLTTLPAGTYELIVVDNGSIDGTVDLVRLVAPEARIITNRDNRGLAAANNQGLAVAAGRAVLICNPDTRFAEGAVGAMRDLLARHDRAGWVVPRLIDGDGSLLTSAGAAPSLVETLLGRQIRRLRSRGEASGFWWDGWAHDEERIIGRGHEAAYLVRAEAVRQVGDQDERYRLDWEGIDWSDRFARSGWETWLAPDAEVVHLGGDSIRQVPWRWVVSQHRGMYLYFADRSRPVWRPLLAVAFASRAAGKMAALAAGLPMYAWSHSFGGHRFPLASRRSDRGGVQHGG